MDLKVLYFYYSDDVKDPDIKEIMEQHRKYKEYYEKKEDNSELSEPSDIDTILDVYSERKKDFKKGGLFTDVYYLLVDYDNKLATEQLIATTEENNKFRGWITDEETYNYINDVFIGTGKLEEALMKVVGIKKGDKKQLL